MSKTFLRTPTRQYNDLEDRESHFVKSSHFAEKIQAEARFYEDLSSDLKNYYPKFFGTISDGRYPFGYSIEKIPASDASLHNVAKVACDDHYFPNLFDLIQSYLQVVPKKTVSPKEWQVYIDKLIIERDQRRLRELGQHSIMSQVDQIYADRGHKSAHDFMSKLHHEITNHVISKESAQVWASHGDLCLSNIIICNERIYLIDPRGKYPNEDGYLLPQYDLAKLSQCILGRYDHINHAITKTSASKNHSCAFTDFLKNIAFELKPIRLIESSHFLAMLPLHLSHPERVLAFAHQSIHTYEECLRL